MLREVSTLVDRADRGNHPFSRRVDTISKQYQDEDDQQYAVSGTALGSRHVGDTAVSSTGSTARGSAASGTDASGTQDDV